MDETTAALAGFERDVARAASVKTARCMYFSDSRNTIFVLPRRRDVATFERSDGWLRIQERIRTRLGDAVGKMFLVSQEDCDVTCDGNWYAYLFK
jgi:hypothetical protein